MNLRWSLPPTDLHPLALTLALALAPTWKYLRTRTAACGQPEHYSSTPPPALAREAAHTSDKPGWEHSVLFHGSTNDDLSIVCMIPQDPLQRNAESCFTSRQPPRNEQRSSLTMPIMTQPGKQRVSPKLPSLQTHY